MITAYGGSRAAIEAMKLGAYDYITKPFDLDEVLFTIRRALTQRTLVEQVQALFGRFVQPTRPTDEADRPFARHASSLQDDRPRRRQRRTGPHRRRKRHGQRTRRQRHSPQFVSLRPALHQGQLRGPQSDACSRANSLATSAAPSLGPSPAAAAVSSRPTAAPCFSTKSAICDIDLQAKLLRVLQTGRVRTGRRRGVAAIQCARDLGNQPRSGGPDRRGTLPRGPALPPQRNLDRAATTARANRRYSLSWPNISCNRLALKYCWHLLCSRSRGHPLPLRADVARQRPPIAECPVARGHPRARPCDRYRRSRAVPSSRKFKPVRRTPRQQVRFARDLGRDRTPRDPAGLNQEKWNRTRTADDCWESAAASSSTRFSSTTCGADGTVAGDRSFGGRARMVRGNGGPASLRSLVPPYDLASAAAGPPDSLGTALHDSATTKNHKANILTEGNKGNEDQTIPYCRSLLPFRLRRISRTQRLLSVKNSFLCLHRSATAVLVFSSRRGMNRVAIASLSGSRRTSVREQSRVWAVFPRPCEGFLPNDAWPLEDACLCLCLPPHGTLAALPTSSVATPAPKLTYDLNAQCTRAVSAI